MRAIHGQLCFATALALGLVGTGVASATPYIVKLTQQGNNVAASGSGAFDLHGLTFVGTGSSGGTAVLPSIGYLVTGSAGSLDVYTGFSGSSGFGSATTTYGSTGSGDPVGMIGNAAALGESEFFVPQGYESDTPLTSSATWDNANFASLGVTPGTYTWMWGTGADQRFTLEAVSAVPEPAALGLFGLGLLLVGGFVGLRRRGVA